MLAPLSNYWGGGGKGGCPPPPPPPSSYAYVFIFSKSISQCRKNTFIYRMRNTKHVYNRRFLGSCSFKSHHGCIHTMNIPCLITAKVIRHITEAFAEYCFRYTWGRIVWMQPTSVCVFGGCSRLRQAFVKKMMQWALLHAKENDATDFLKIIKRTQRCKTIE